MADHGEGITRRTAVIAGAAAGVAGAATLSSPPDAEAAAHARAKAGPAGRMPVAFVPHGGGPWPFVDLGFDPTEMGELAAYLRSLSALPKTPPKALLVISAHWEEPVPTVMTAAQPPMLYDYYGFPPESYEITWPAPGNPTLAARVQKLLEGAGFKTAANAKRGYDHGTFVPLKLTYPAADVPTVQLSLKAGLAPAEHLAMGRALAPLRDEGVFIIGSGMTYHNLRAFRDPRSVPVAETFDRWLREAVTAAPVERERRLNDWAAAPAARQAHPREEHLLPLMVIAGAAGDDLGKVDFAASVMGLRVSGYHFG